jgi:adenosine deaminase
VWEALDLLGVARVDHGNRALEDDALVSRLARERKPLTVCPLSNQRLQVVPDLAHHPLRQMMEKDLLVTLNSDDPAYFGGYVNDNFRALRQAIGLTRSEMVAVARNSFVAAMMPAEDKARALAEFDRAVAAL